MSRLGVEEMVNGSEALGCFVEEMWLSWVGRLGARMKAFRCEIIVHLRKRLIGTDERMRGLFLRPRRFYVCDTGMRR